MMRSLLLPIGVPSFIQVNEIGIGLAIACNKSSAKTFPSVPTALYDGGGMNFGGSMVKEKKIQYINHFSSIFLRWVETFSTKYLHRTFNVIASWTLRCKISLWLWHVYTTPFDSCVAFIFNSYDETVPPHKPGFDTALMPSTNIPSFHQLNLAGGLLELESQMSVASTPGTNSAGCVCTLTVSGATVHSNIQTKIPLTRDKYRGKKIEKHQCFQRVKLTKR